MPKQRYMQNVRPMFVSLVSKAANRREFLTRKDDDGHDVETVQVPILKCEDVDGVRYITGVAYEPGVVDTQGDAMTAEEIAKAAHLYMRDYRGVDVQHSNEPEPGCWVAESAVLKADTEIGGEMVPAGAWVMTAGIENPDVVARIDKGELNGFSIGGFAQYVLKADDASEETPPKWFQKLWSALTDRFGVAREPKEPEPEAQTEPKEPEPKEPEQENKTKEENKPMKKSEYLALADELIAKGAMEDDTQGDASAPVSKQDTAPADVGAVIAKAIADGFAMVAKAQAPQPEAPAPEPEPPAAPVSKQDTAPQTITTDDIAAIVKSAVDEQIAPMQQTVNTLAAAYNAGPKNLNGTSQPVEKGAEPHYMEGFFSA